VAALALFAALRPFQAVLLLGALGPLAGIAAIRKLAALRRSPPSGANFPLSHENSLKESLRWP
jgi:hypothetical protein